MELLGASVEPTLGCRLKSISDARKDPTGDETPIHVALDVAGIDPNPLPFVLSFNNLTYSVKIRKKLNKFKMGADENVFSTTKILLNDISGDTRDGEILAVLGASGSGKSTLIDALANRIAKGSLKGTMTFNGEEIGSRLLKTISAYVMQDDLLFPMLTVEETLTFAAEFRLPRSLSRSKKKVRVQNLIDQLGLRNAAGTVIGDEGHRGVSGGERRRVSIGTDIIHDPIVLFLDEPTSGLDSTSAYMVVKVLQRIARSGSIVVMTVHQPSSRIVGLLDQLLFLSQGQTVYSGPPSSLPEFFSEFGHPIPENENRTEFALDLIRELEGSPGGTKSLVEYHKTWQYMKRTGAQDTPGKAGLSLKEAISASISRGKLVSGAAADPGATSVVPDFANPMHSEILILSKRSALNSWRMPELFGIRLAAVAVTGFILATVFWQLDNTPKGAQERIAFFAFAMSTMYYTTADALPVFVSDRFIFIRETAYNTYRRSSYVLSHAITSLPALFFLSLTFALITFFAVGLDGEFHGFIFYLLIIFSAFWSGNSFVTFLSGFIPHVMIGYVVVVAALAYYLLFSGFFITRERIPSYWIWFHYMSLIKYPFGAVLQNEFDNTNRCFVRGIQIFDNSPLGNVPYTLKLKLLENMSQTLGMNITATTCVTTGVDVLENQGVTDLSKWNCLWVTVAWGFFFRILFYFCLLLGSKNKRS